MSDDPFEFKSPPPKRVTTHTFYVGTDRQFEDALAFVKRVCPTLSLERQIAVAEKVVAALPKHIRKG